MLMLVKPPVNCYYVTLLLPSDKHAWIHIFMRNTFECVPVVYFVHMYMGLLFIHLRSHGVWTETCWQDIIVGDLIKLKCDEIFPADLLLLHTASVDGVCFIETANLDGETNLKQRRMFAEVYRGYCPTSFILFPCHLPPAIHRIRYISQIYDHHSDG